MPEKVTYDLAKVLVGTEYLIAEEVEESIEQDDEEKRGMDSFEAYDRKPGDITYELSFTNIDMTWRDKLRKYQKSQSNRDVEGLTVALFDYNQNGSPVLVCTYLKGFISSLTIQKVNNSLDMTVKPLQMILP